MPVTPRSRYRALPDAAYDPRVTDVNRPLNVPPGTGGFGPVASGAAALVVPGSGGQFFNRNVTNLVPFQLVANVSVRALAYNPRRSGLIIQNQDAAAPMNYSLGADRKFRGLVIAAGGTVLFDFTTPPDTLYIISGANILAVIAEIARQG
ncbi:MAG: hypothetical protein ACYDDA_03785 [Acidiferrobacteraceae bacterium]